MPLVLALLKLVVEVALATRGRCWVENEVTLRDRSHASAGTDRVFDARKTCSDPTLHDQA